MFTAILYATVLVGASIGEDKELLFFYADGVAPAKAVLPIVDRMEKDGYRVERIDVDKSAARVREFGVRNIPTIIVTANGQEIRRLVGLVSHEQLLSAVTSSSTSRSEARSRVQLPETSIPGATEVQTLSRAKYKLPEGKGRALADFLRDHAQGVESIVEEDNLIITTTPQLQGAIGVFVREVFQHCESRDSPEAGEESPSN